MAFISDSALDAGLSYISNNAVAIHICSQEPSTYAQATATYSVGVETGIAFSGPANATPSGRKITTSASDGDITADGTATHWAIVSANAVLATGELPASQQVYDVNTFDIGEIEVRLRDAI